MRESNSLLNGAKPERFENFENPKGFRCPSGAIKPQIAFTSKAYGSESKGVASWGRPEFTVQRIPNPIAFAISESLSRPFIAESVDIRLITRWVQLSWAISFLLEKAPISAS
jgi:hypothetical protein